ncbi:MAG: radical SAM protein [Promethearchaeota archaeon]
MLTRVQRLKIDLFVDGMTISPLAKVELSHISRNRPLTLADYATTSGIPLILPDDIWVNVPINDYNPNFVVTPRYILDWDETVFTIRSNEFKCIVTPLPVPDYNFKLNSAGEPHSWYGIIHTDRVRIAPIAGCSNSCKFCDLPRKFKYKKKSIPLLIESIHAAISEQILPARHVLISGGTPKDSDFQYLNDVYFKILEAFPSVPIDIMMLPINEVLDLSALQLAGLHGLSINLELYNDSARKELMPEKNTIHKNKWLSFIEKAVEVFGSNVRSALIVGLEPIEDTIQGVRALAERGCSPVLSPFRPDPTTPLSDLTPPSANLLADVYQKAIEVLASYDVKLGPKCIPCQHNTLTFPDGSDYYHRFLL